MAWIGAESFLRKAERSVAGTPFQSPFAIANVIVELGIECLSFAFMLRLLIILLGRHRQQGHIRRTDD